MVETEDFGTSVLGTCESMCPQSEISLRERENLLHPFEVCVILKDGRKKANPKKMVKEFRRPAAGMEHARPAELRPPHILKMTVDYLLGNIAVKTDYKWSDVYDFVFDRLRAVRQDLVIQNIGGDNAIEILEKITRFHIYAGYRLCDLPMELYDPNINNQHTQECIKRLLSLYQRVPGPHLNQEEFESLYLLFNLGQSEALMHYFDLPAEVRNLGLVRTTYQINNAYIVGNFVRVLRLSHSCFMKDNPLCLCAFHRHLSTTYSNLLHIMSWGYHSKNSNYPVKHLGHVLYVDNTDHVIKLCKNHGLDVKDGSSVIFLKSSYKNPDKIACTPTKDIDTCLQSTSLPNLLLKNQSHTHSE